LQPADAVGHRLAVEHQTALAAEDYKLLERLS
jgi:hypothetical protein